MPEESLDAELRGLIFRFSYRFSRFEFALKQANFLRSHAAGNRAEPDWRYLVERYENYYRLSNAAKALIQADPKQQIVGDDGKSLTFTPVDRGKASDMAHVVALVRTVRNNLFHGGKHDNEGWDNPMRIRQLVEHSTNVLDELADQTGLSSDYHGLY